MKIHGIVLSLAAGMLFSAAALAQQTSDRGDPLRTPGAAQRMAPMELQPQTSLREFPSETFFPSDIFNERQIQNLERAGIGNVGQLIEADPRRLGQSLGMNPREVEAAQRKMRTSLQSSAASPGRSAQQRMAPMELQPQTSLREFPSETFFPSGIFNERQIQNLERAGIGNVGQLVQADPRRLGRMLGMNPREVEAAQQDLKASLP